MTHNERSGEFPPYDHNATSHCETAADASVEIYLPKEPVNSPRPFYLHTTEPPHPVSSNQKKRTIMGVVLNKILYAISAGVDKIRNGRHRDRSRPIEPRGRAPRRSYRRRPRPVYHRTPIQHPPPRSPSNSSGASSSDSRISSTYRDSYSNEDASPRPQSVDGRDDQDIHGISRGRRLSRAEEEDNRARTMHRRGHRHSPGRSHSPLDEEGRSPASSSTESLMSDDGRGPDTNNNTAHRAVGGPDVHAGTPHGVQGDDHANSDAKASTGNGEGITTDASAPINNADNAPDQDEAPDDWEDWSSSDEEVEETKEDNDQNKEKRQGMVIQMDASDPPRIETGNHRTSDASSSPSWLQEVMTPYFNQASTNKRATRVKPRDETKQDDRGSSAPVSPKTRPQSRDSDSASDTSSSTSEIRLLRKEIREGKRPEHPLDLGQTIVVEQQPPPLNRNIITVTSSPGTPPNPNPDPIALSERDTNVAEDRPVTREENTPPKRKITIRVPKFPRFSRPGRAQSDRRGGVGETRRPRSPWPDTGAEPGNKPRYNYYWDA